MILSKVGNKKVNIAHDMPLIIYKFPTATLYLKVVL